ncbi:MAG: hypothetical protein J6X55_16640, partial [Victivallales bacterium]|nr:hypothetical protein [Victivallales bacterium]
DAAGNVSDVATYAVTNIDKVAPEAPTASASTTEPINQNVTVSATFSDDSAVKEYSLDNSTWNAYTNGIELSENGTVYFRGIDAAGNISDVTSCEVTNIDKVAPETAEVTLSFDNAIGKVVFTATWDMNDAECFYSLDGAVTWQRYEEPLYFSQDGTVNYYTVDAVGNKSEVGNSVIAVSLTSEDTALEAGEEGQATATWNNEGVEAWSDGYDVQLNLDGTRQVVLQSVDGHGIELLNTPAFNLNFAVKPSQVSEWTKFEESVEMVPVTEEGSQLVQAETNGLADVMFGCTTGIWSVSYHARHSTLKNEKKVELKGRNIIGDVFIGSDDATIMLLTDDSNGDGFFLDDNYSAFPEGMDAQARLAKIDEIYAGAGNDVVDLTSKRFEYVGDSVTVKGGLGNDVIWANKGNNLLFGDAGNDRIIGADGDDVIVGGAGNDSLHGNGGDDTFVFGGDWGNDTVELVEGGKVTLWFDEGDESKWDAASLTYKDGDKSVKVTGVADVTLKFGDDNGNEKYAGLFAAGAFDEFTSEKIFEDKNKGMLA